MNKATRKEQIQLERRNGHKEGTETWESCTLTIHGDREERDGATSFNHMVLRTNIFN